MNDTPAPDYGEPWKPSGKFQDIAYTRSGMVGTDSQLYRDRIIVCVNVCVGMADPAAEIAAMREAIKEAHKALSTCEEFIKDAHIIEAQWHWGPVRRTAAALAKLQPFIK